MDFKKHNRADELKKWKQTGGPGPKKSLSYGTLQDHGHPLLLLHHVEVLAKVWRHVPLSQVFWIVLIHSVEIPLFVRGCGRGWWGHHCSPSVTIHRTVLLGSYRIKQKKALFCMRAQQHFMTARQPDKRSPARGHPNWPTRHSHDGWCLLVASHSRGWPPSPTLPPARASFVLTSVLQQTTGEQPNKATVSSDKLFRY